MKKIALITLTCLGSIAFLLLAWQLRDVIGILVVAILLATTMSGFVVALINRGWSPRSARLAIILGTLLFIVLFLVVLVYAVGERLPQALNDFRTMYGEMRAALVSGNRAQAAIALRLPSPVRLDDILLGADGSGLLAIFSGISSTFGAMVSNIVLVIFVALYWVADRDRIESLWLSLLSPNYRTRARNLVYEIEDEIGSNLRSQIVQFVIAFLLLMIGYMVLGQTYPVLTAWLVSICWFVPLVGGILSMIAAFLLGLIDGYIAALGVIAFTLAVFVIIPKITARYQSLRQRPGSIMGLMITIALVDVLGVFGLIVAMPVTVAAHVIISHILNSEPAKADVLPEVENETLLNNLAAIQTKIVEGEEKISPRTVSMFRRLEELVAVAGIKD